MKRVVLMLALALVIPVLATAADFTFYTTGAFSNCANASSCTFGNTTISFAGVGVPTPVSGNNPSFGKTLGTFTISGSTPTADTLAGDFTLSVFQLTPENANGAFVGTLAGTIAYNSPAGYWYFSTSNQVLSLGTGVITQYSLTLDNKLCPLGPCIRLDGPSDAGNGSTTVKADITQVPEPASIMLFGSGLTGLAGVIRRRFKK